MESPCKLTFKVQEKMWIVLYFSCKDFKKITHSSKPNRDINGKELGENNVQVNHTFLTHAKLLLKLVITMATVSKSHSSLH